MSIKESALNAITSITQSDFIRAVTAAGASRRVTVANLAKAIIESYTGSSLAGANQSVKAALDSLNNKTIEVAIPASGSKTLTSTSYTPFIITFHGYTGTSRGALVGISDASSMLIYNWLGTAPSDIAITSTGTRQITITNNGQYQTTCFVNVLKGSVSVS